MKIMAVDYGAARTGLAVCDKSEFLASPIGVIHERDYRQLINKVAYTAQQYEVSHVVVGLPKNMDGTLGEKAQKCQDFAQKLEVILQIPVTMWDERQTTMQATTYLNEVNVRGQKRKDIIDEVAATIILESFLAFRRNTNEN